MRKLFLTLILCFACITAIADTRYVAGPKDAVLRAGPSEYADVSSKLVAGSQVDVIGIDRSTDYALIVTPDKKRGWLPSSQLTTTAPASPVLAQPDAPAATATATPDSNAASTATTNPAAATPSTPVTITTTTPAATSSMNPSQPYYKDVKEKLHDLASANAGTPNTVVKMSTQEMINFTAVQRENRAWFISGALVLILGMFIGIIMSRIAFKRRRSSWD